MFDRRRSLAALAASILWHRAADPKANNSTAQPSFDDLWQEVQRDPNILLSTRSYREGREVEYEVFGLGKPMAPRYEPSLRSISDDAVKMIIGFEVTDELLYKRRYRQPIWPKGKSGVTVGIGYDVGYAKPAWVREDWSGILSDRYIELLSKACGVTGVGAKKFVPELKSITIDWDDARKQFVGTSLRRYTAQTLGVLKNADLLSDDSLGALVSLVYNRGPSFKLVGPRYEEMRKIRLLVVKKDFSAIPNEIRRMVRLWENTEIEGLCKRRLLEAALFERGLQDRARKT